MGTFEITNFQEDVIEKSHQTPVLVDFWAPWCGPCRTLGPVLEKLASENEGSWTLAKVNTDQNQEVSMQYGIRGIPAVKLFVDGNVVDEFTGALPEYAVQQWLDKALPSENKQRLEQAEVALSAGEPDRAEAILRHILTEEPNNPKARIMLAQILAFSHPKEAAELAQSAAFDGPASVQIADAIQTIASLSHKNTEALPEDVVKPTYVEAIRAVGGNDFDTAISKFIEVIQHNRYYDDDGARKAGIAVFTLLGPTHATTKKYRRTFDMWLY